ncbi:DUF599 domain-containing protein [Acidobacteriota bacterium]
MDSGWTEYAIILVTFIILLSYHIHLVVQVRHNPLKTAIGTTNHSRRAWVETMVEQKMALTAVQTLRNWTMAASLLASTAILLSLAMLNFAFKAEKFSEITQRVNLLGFHNETLLLIKWLLPALLFFAAFFNFTLSIRYYNHAGFMINVPGEKDHSVTTEHLTGIVNRGAIHYHLGMRSYYLSVPFVMWLFGPIWMLAGALLMTCILYKLDRIV